VSGPIDGLVALQWVGVVLPTLAVTALFIRLGALLKTIQRLEADTGKMAATLSTLTALATSLEAWRDASKNNHEDVLERVRRLEDIELKR
jgi:hypothetical protein